jgi:hypothetical protein
LRWEYQINANEEAIRLDPSIPSLAIGNPLPTAADGGGDGLWVGLNSGIYKLRLGKANGVGLHWTGSAVELRNSNNVPTITLDASGNSRFDGAMTIGALGGIWQGTGSFATPTTGLKLYNSGGIGRLSTYNGGLEQITINTSGQLVAGQGKVVLDRDGLGITVQNAPNLNSAVSFYSTGDTIPYGALEGVSLGGAYLLSLRTSIGGRMGRLVLDQSTTKEKIYMETTGGGSRLEVDSQYGISLGAPTIRLSGDTEVSGGLAVGSQTAAPDAGALFLNARTSTVTVWPGGGQLWVQTVGGVQKLYVKFGNGTVRELASA